MSEMEPEPTQAPAAAVSVPAAALTELSEKEIDTIVSVFRICCLCQEVIRKAADVRVYACGCYHHYRSCCPSIEEYLEHPATECSLIYKCGVLTQFVTKYQDGKLTGGEFFRKYLDEKCPNFMQKAELLKMKTAAEESKAAEEEAKNQAIELEKRLKRALDECTLYKAKLAGIEKQRENGGSGSNSTDKERRPGSADGKSAEAAPPTKRIKVEYEPTGDEVVLNFEWNAFKEQFNDVQNKTTRLLHSSAASRNLSLIRANYRRIDALTETVDNVKETVVDAIRKGNEQMKEALDIFVSPSSPVPSQPGTPKKT